MTRAAAVLVVLAGCAPARPALRAPIPVEAGRACVAGLGCVAYQARGQAARDAGGRVGNAVVVLTAFGYGEDIDALWPGLVGAGRALDPARRLVVGVAFERGPDGALPRGDAAVALLDRFLDERAIDRRAPLLGAASYGAELALRALGAGVVRGPVLACGGHDRPFEEPAMRRVRAALADPEPFAAVARAMVPASYGPGYLDDPRSAREHALPEGTPLAAALAARMAAHLAAHTSLDALAARMDSAFALEASPIAYPPLGGRRVVLVANRDDLMMTIARVRDLAARLRARGADVELVELDDRLGHSAFFGRTPPALVAAARALVGR